MPIVASDIKYYESKSTASADGEATGDGLGGYRSSDEITTDVTENVFDSVSAAESADGDTEYRCIFVKNTHATLTLYSSKCWLTSSGSPECSLTTQLENAGSETTVYVDDNSDFPATGAFFIEDEEIAYTGIAVDNLSFTGCTRGSNGTSKVQHTVGTIIEHNQVRIDIEEPSSKSSGYVQTIATEGTTPSALTFTNPRSYAAGKSIGDLAAGEFYGIWIRRKVPLGCQAKSGIQCVIDVQGSTTE